MSKADPNRTNLQAIEKRISDEAKKLEQAKARLHQLNARKKAISRSERTRRLILIGAVMVAKAEKEEDFKACLMNWLDEGIIAERDRALFDLARPEESLSHADAECRTGRRAVAEENRRPGSAA